MDAPTPPSSSGCFPTTQWTLILKVIQQGDEDAAWRALEDFCELYRPAVYGFFRRKGCLHQQAEDYTQDFFLTRIHRRWDLRKGFLFSAERREQSRFRVFFYTVLRAFLIEKWRVKSPIIVDGELADSVASDCQSEGGRGDAGKEFDRAFAMETIRQAIEAAKGSQYHVAHWKNKLSQAKAAAALGMSEKTFRVSYFRFRARFRDKLRALVRKQLGDELGDDGIDEEIRYLMSLFVSSVA